MKKLEKGSMTLVRPELCHMIELHLSYWQDMSVIVFMGRTNTNRRKRRKEKKRESLLKASYIYTCM